MTMPKEKFPWDRPEAIGVRQNISFILQLRFTCYKMTKPSLVKASRAQPGESDFFIHYAWSK